ncbi:magnesium transporter [Labedella gwakjiensis]|uniref:Magnesium and cobalt transport protein CorA n=1 Tax=Labedella gwakjiensis TaxID=390269 RepID=A0A2P8GUJ9_9MICO|nr:magnesium and cobalt transport protein CorA [Labedella gwakjiensis]PSL37647.1 magnesium transporter [Labedella gwakjiensis]RUQ87756.1 magnesium and cobalt transport protein CorA [Labedella gwakjiensis]
MALIDNGIYRNGHRVADPASLEQTFDALDDRGGLAWIGLYRPTNEELTAVAREFSLHPLAVEDARKGHQRAKLERYGDTLFAVLRPAWYDEENESVEFGEIHIFTGPTFVVTVRHASKPALADVRKRLEGRPGYLAAGSEAVLTAILDEIIDGYSPVVAGVQDDIDEIEDDLFDGQVDPESSKRIYQLLSEVIGFQRAIGPLSGMLDALLRGAAKYGTNEDVQDQLRNVYDHAIRITERVDTFRALLENALTLHSTLVTQEQNDAMRRMTRASLAQGEESRQLTRASIAQGEEVKKISSWAAILFAPTLIASIYGMNFDHMPELHWVFGYPFAVGLMVVLGVVLWTIFKRRNWL